MKRSYKDNDYSAPTRYCHQNVLAKGYVDRVEIVRQGETFAVHASSYDELYYRFTDPRRFRTSVAHNLELSSATNGNSVLVLLRLFLMSEHQRQHPLVAISSRGPNSGPRR